MAAGLPGGKWRLLDAFLRGKHEGGVPMNHQIPCSISRFHFAIRLFSLLVCLIYLLCVGSSIAQASSRSKKKPSSPATASPAAVFSGGVGLFFPITPLSEDNLRYWFTPQIEKAAALGLQFVNLVVHWKDLEPQNNIYAFDMMGRYMQVIKTSGLQCVLRIYFNGGRHIQASPDWLFEEKGAAYCWEGDYIQPLPCDRIYFDEMTSFMNTLAIWMAGNSQRQPQALQISAGGVYGEMAVLGFDWQTAFQDDYDQFYNMLTAANKDHVDIFAAFSRKLASIPLILMINHLYDNNPALNDQLMDYAWKNHGLRWFQSNAWSGNLEQQRYGPLVLDMMERHAAGGLFSLEDEAGAHDETLAQRIQRMERIQFETGVHFQSVSLNIVDLTTENQADIRYLVSLTRTGKTS
jgi:hypothetical protein